MLMKFFTSIALIELICTAFFAHQQDYPWMLMCGVITILAIFMSNQMAREGI